jgi:hypothetical protein
MRPSHLLTCLLLAAAPASAQQSDLCAVPGTRTIRGVVVDPTGKAVSSGRVSLTRRGEHDGRAILQHCVTDIRADGSFEFTGIVSDSLRLRAWTLWPTEARISIPPGIETAVLEVRLTTPPPRLRDFADFDIRPDPLRDPKGIPGCYWLGHAWGVSRVIELRSDHRVDWRTGRSATVPRWEERGRDSVRVFSFEHQLWGWAGFTMDLTPPVDWSAIPTLFEDETDVVVRPDEWESFVTRIPCVDPP